ncbi:MAG TPA: carboxypeptidase regulatory-like domain-containing protein [Bryobacteraceae bacterium]|nr:carboxypeptidase regulatory-like domain-containing protein [Bryobacteraceae bacterium]
MKIVNLLQLAFVVFSLSTAFGQRTTTSISGTVTDASGANVPGTEIRAVSPSTGATAKAMSNSDGFYVISNLSPGEYHLRAEKAGFQAFAQEGVLLQVNRPVTVNIALQIGASTQTVTVAGESEQVNLRSQTLSYTVTSEMAKELPLNGRNILQLMSLAPDAGPTSSSGYQQGASRPENANAFVGASGGRGDSTTFYLDGGLNEDALTEVANIFPNPDAIQEFSFETNNYSAKFGGRGGGVMNAVTRGGTNQFHGSAFEFVRNGKLNARNFFAPVQDGLKRNQYGGTIGGPIRKDKTFLFFSYQGTKLRVAPTTNTSTTLTQAQRNGDFSAVRRQLINPDNNQPFANNQVPASLFDPIALKILALVPAGAPGTGLVFYPSRTVQNTGQYVTRLDHNFNDKFRVYASYLFDELLAPSTSIADNLLTATTNQRWRSQTLVLNTSYAFRPNLLTTFSASMSRRFNAYTGPPGFPGWPELGARVPKMTDQGSKTSLRLSISGYFGAGWNGFYTIPSTVGNAGNHWTWIKGNHSFEFGGEVTHSKVVKNQDFLSDGNYNFNAQLSGDNGLDFLLGRPSVFSQQEPFYIVPVRTLPALYVTDTWKVSRRLTLSLGVRWNPFVPVDEVAYHQAGLFSLDLYNKGVRSTLYPNSPPGLLVQGDPGVPARVMETHYALFNPRVGFAFDPFGDGKTSIRAGYGMYQDQATGNTINPNYNPFTIQTTINFPASTADPYRGQVNPFPIARPHPSTVTFPLPMTANPFSYGMKAPTIQQWNFTIERQLPASALIRVAYEGQSAYHLFGSVEANAAVYDPLLSVNDNRRTITQRRPLGQYYQGLALGKNIGTSSFNALVVSVEKRMAHGFSVLGGYRWSKCLNMSDSAFFDANAYASPNPRFDRGPCGYNVPHQLRFSYGWQLPGFQSLGSIAKTVIGGWQTNGILNVRDGLPFSVSSGIDNSFTGIGRDRADIIGDPNLSNDRPKAERVAQYFNTRAFQSNALGTFGTSSRNMLIGPGLATFDIAISKQFPLRFGKFAETQKLTFRAEFFNLFNRANFGNPNASLISSTFGRITSAGEPRITQLSMKFVF